MQVGFIGTGSMGSILINSFIAAKALLPEQIIAANRTPSKVERLAEQHPGLTVAEKNKEVAESSQLIFLCVKPLEYRKALDELAPYLMRNQVLITITSPVTLQELAQNVPCPVVRVIPSITNAACNGLSLVEFGEGVSEETKTNILSLISHIGKPLEIEERFIRIAADISSCGPAFISYILQQMIHSAAEETGIAHETAVFLTTQMIIGLGELLKQGIFTLPELQERVCVPGGITGEGLHVLQKDLPRVFNGVFKRTHAKFAEDCHEMRKSLGREGGNRS